jgi:hypothetical protein
VRWTVLTLILVALVPGCGGGESGSLTHAEWSQRADAACKRAANAIVKRGWAGDLHVLQSVSSDTAADVHKATAEIRRLPAPATARVRPFIAGLGDLERVLDDLVRASTAMDTGDLEAIATRVGGTLSGLESSAHGAGLRWCLQHDERKWLPDGIRAPVIAEQLVRIDRSFPRRTYNSPRSLRRLADALSGMHAQLVRLDPPAWVVGEMAAYEAAVAEYASVVDTFADEVAAGRFANPSKLKARFIGANDAVERAHNRLTRKLGAAPVGVADAVPDESA